MNIRPSAAELARREAERRVAAAESAYGRLVPAASELARTIEEAGGTPPVRLPAQLSDFAGSAARDAVARANALEAALEEARLEVDAMRTEARRAAAREEAKESEVAALLDTLADDELTEAFARRPDPARKSDVIRALDTLMERAGAVLHKDTEWPQLRDRGEAIRAIDDPAQQRNELAGLKVLIGERVARLDRRRRWAESLEALMDSAAHVSGRAAPVVAELRALRDAEAPVPLEPYAERLAEAVSSEEAATDRARATEVVLRTLEELGYAVSPEAMGTALVEDGRLVIHRHPSDEHGVEIRAAETVGGTHLRTEIVRLRLGEGEQARRRDYEREEAWCQEHAAIRENLAEEGYRTDMVVKREPGETAIRLVEPAETGVGKATEAARRPRKQEAE